MESAVEDGPLFKDYPKMKDAVRTFFHHPINFGKIEEKVRSLIEELEEMSQHVRRMMQEANKHGRRVKVHRVAMQIQRYIELEVTGVEEIDLIKSKVDASRAKVAEFKEVLAKVDEQKATGKDIEGLKEIQASIEVDLEGEEKDVKKGIWETQVASMLAGRKVHLEEFKQLVHEAETMRFDVREDLMGQFVKLQEKIAEMEHKVKHAEEKEQLDKLAQEDLPVDFEQEINDKRAQFLLGKRKGEEGLGEEELAAEREKKRQRFIINEDLKLNQSVAVPKIEAESDESESSSSSEESSSSSSSSGSSSEEGEEEQEENLNIAMNRSRRQIQPKLEEGFVYPKFH